MSSVTKACPSCATPLPAEAAFCMMCGAATPHSIDKATGEIRQYSSDRIPSPDLNRLQRVLGSNYDLGKLIGRGGFAEVFLVHDRRLKRDLALKALRPDLVISEALLARFRREAETVAALRHPHIVPIYDIGEAEGIAYILMPLIQGESLRALLMREGPRPVREASRILLEASDALGAAHEAGVIHRDIKPENIMLEGKARRVQLMDFGIAKAIDHTDGTPGLTSTGMLVGTPHYMSPEQASGDPHLDNRSDQYSLAVVGFQMITGSLPFDGESTRAVLFQQMVGVPKSLRDLVPDVPAAMAFAVDRALSKDPKARFPSMEAFREALSGSDAWPPEGAVSSITPRPSVSTPTVGAATAATTPAGPVRQRRLLVAALGAVAVTATAVALWSTIRDRGSVIPPAPVPLAVTPVPPPTAAAPIRDSANPVATKPPASGGLPNPAPSNRRAPGAGLANPAASSGAQAPAATLAAGSASCQAASASKKWAEALRWCTAEAEGGNATASRILAGLYQRGSGVAASDSAAAAWYRKASVGGDVQASYRLALMYGAGTGVIQNDVEATNQMRKAAEGNVEAAWPLLAERYEQGLGVKRNDKEAAVWYRKAADNGERAAQYNLGEMFMRGRGVDKSEEEAAQWFSKAAQLDHPGAEYQLGMMYIRGRGGIPKDEGVGLQWLEKAAAQGHEDAKKEVAKRRRP